MHHGGVVVFSDFCFTTVFHGEKFVAKSSAYLLVLWYRRCVHAWELEVDLDAL